MYEERQEGPCLSLYVLSQRFVTGTCLDKEMDLAGLERWRRRLYTKQHLFIFIKNIKNLLKTLDFHVCPLYLSMG
jgi:hypothetical protein